MPLRTDNKQQHLDKKLTNRIVHLEGICKQYEKYKDLYESKPFLEWVKDELQERLKKHESDRVRIDLLKPEGHEGDIQIQAKQREIIDMINLPHKRRQEAQQAEAELIEIKKKGD